MGLLDSIIEGYKGLPLWAHRLAFGGCMLVVMALSLMPAEVPMPSTGWDKSNHFLAFFVLTLLGGVAYPGRTALVLTGLLAYGGLIEVLQSFTPSRSAEWGDLLADAVGLLLGWMVLQLVRMQAQMVDLKRSDMTQMVCQQCHNGTEMHYGKEDMTITHGAMARQVFAVSGWHCPVCKECVFDLGEGMRCVETLEAMILDSVPAAPVAGV